MLRLMLAGPAGFCWRLDRPGRTLSCCVAWQLQHCISFQDVLTWLHCRHFFQIVITLQMPISTLPISTRPVFWWRVVYVMFCRWKLKTYSFNCCCCFRWLPSPDVCDRIYDGRLVTYIEQPTTPFKSPPRLLYFLVWNYFKILSKRFASNLFH